MTKKEEAERLKTAKELCQKEGKDWDALDDYGKHSYLHYADIVIRKRAQAPQKPAEEILETPSNQCPACGGKGFIEEQHGLVQVECEACGGTGVITTEKQEETPEEKSAPVHKHYYRKDGICACGAKLSPAGMKRRELKARKGK